MRRRQLLAATQSESMLLVRPAGALPLRSGIIRVHFSSRIALIIGSSPADGETARRSRIQRRRVRQQLQAINPSNSLAQRQSPLWGKLPPELRNDIFVLAVSQHLHLSRPYPRNSWYYRPGYTHAFRVCTDLLLTCRLAYWETNAIPLRNATLPVWVDRGPPDAPRWRFGEFTAKNTAELNHVHFFVSRPSGLWYTPLPQFRPKRITVTIRHTSWWGWHQDKPLSITGMWRTALLPPHTKFPSCFEELVIEFETLERKKNQLDDIISNNAMLWRFEAEGGSILSPLHVPPKYSRWTGPADIGGVWWRAAHGDRETIDYYIVALTWRADRPGARKS